MSGVNEYFLHLSDPGILNDMHNRSLDVSLKNAKFINPRRACAVRVTVLGLCVCVCVCYSTSHVYSYHKQY